MLVDLNKKFLDLDGKEIEDSTMAKEISRVLALSGNSQQFGLHPVRAMEIATAFHSKGECDLDDNSKDQLKRFVEAQQFSNLAKTQLLAALSG